MTRRGYAECSIFQRGKDDCWVSGITLSNGRWKFAYLALHADGNGR